MKEKEEKGCTGGEEKGERREGMREKGERKGRGEKEEDKGEKYKNREGNYSTLHFQRRRREDPRSLWQVPNSKSEYSPQNAVVHVNNNNHFSRHRKVFKYKPKFHFSMPRGKERIASRTILISTHQKSQKWKRRCCIIFYFITFN